MNISTEPLHLQLRPFFLSRKNFYQLMLLLFTVPQNDEAFFRIGSNADFKELEEIHEGGKILHSFFERFQAEQLENEMNEYQRLFIGPGPLAAPPWESFYRSKERLLFSKWTFTIRDLYHQFGLEFTKENNEPDDHLLPELEFIIHLLELSLLETDMAGIKKYIKSQIEFLEQHLTVWIPYFCERVIENTGSQLYLGAAMLLEDFLYVDLASLIELWEVLLSEQ